MRANQGFYKFKKDIKRIAYDTQAVTGKVVDLRNNVDGYAVVGSTEGDMIKSVGKNLANSNELALETGTIKTEIEKDGTIILNTKEGKIWSGNGRPSGIARFKIFEPCTLTLVLEHISGTSIKTDGNPITIGTRIILWKGDQYTTTDDVITQTFSYSFPLEGKNVKTFIITQEYIELGANMFEFCLWANGSASPRYFNDLKLRVSILYDDAYDDDYEYEPYKEDRKVCNQNDRCYINTFANGSVYSENDRTITVNFTKSMFASAYRAIANRVNNMDGDDYEEKTVNFFGDSITAGTNTTEAYHMWLSRYTGFHCKNWGVGGSGYIQELTGSFHTGDGIEGIAELKPQTGKNKILTIMKSVGELGNCMIFAGTNDWAAAYDIDAFRTAVQNTLDYAWEHSDRLLVLTPIKRYRGEVKNSAGKRLHEFSGVIIEECIKRGIPYIDGYEMPFDSNNDISALKYYAKEGVDKVHINEAGHKLMAGYLLDRFKAVFK